MAYQTQPSTTISFCDAAAYITTVDPGIALSSGAGYWGQIWGRHNYASTATISGTANIPTGQVNTGFCDGHVKSMSRSEIADPANTNKYWATP